MAAFPQQLIPAAKSAYRSVVRSARVTFQGDPQAHQAILHVLRQTYQSPTLTTPPREGGLEEPSDVGHEEIVKRIDEWKEVAEILRKNVVQGRRTEKGAYDLRITKDTELGYNDSVKKPKAMPVTPFPNRGKRRRRASAEAEAGAGAKESTST